LALTDGPAQADNHCLFLRFNRKKTGPEKNDQKQEHHDLDDPEAAAESLSQRFGAGIDGSFRHGRGLRSLFEFEV
jgi:hypothetical protein